MKNSRSDFSAHIKNSFETITTIEINKSILLAGYKIQFTFFNPHMADILMRPFQHLGTDNISNPDFQVFVCEEETSGIRINHEMLLSDNIELLDNQTLYYNSKNVHMLYNTLTSITSLVDTGTKKAYYYINSLKNLPDFEKAAPFRMFFHWFSLTHNLSLIHGAVVGTGKNGFLLAGRGGVGKSTLSLLSFIDGSTFLGDDYVLIKNGNPIRAYSLYNSIKLNEDIIDRYPYIHHYIANRNSKAYYKGYLFADELPEGHMADSIELKGIIMLTGERASQPEFIKGSSIKALSVIGSSSVLQMPGINKDFLGDIRKLVSALPIHEFILGPSVDLNKECFYDFIDKTPLISIIIPVYNGSRHIESAIDSALNQTYENIELLVVDDGSTDGTKDIIAGLNNKNIKYIYQENQGPGAARNTGIENSSGKYIAFLDSDDIYHPDKIEKQLTYMKDNPGLKVQYCEHNLILEKSEKNYPWMTRIDGEMAYNYEIPSGMFVKKDIFSYVGLFNPSYTLAEDSDLYLRIKDSGLKWQKLHDKLYDKNIHDTNISSNISGNRKNVTRLLAESIKRKRIQKNLKISVIIPAYNPDIHLVSCIKSILKQSLQPYEIVIADDGSKNDISSLLSCFNDDRIKIFRQDNKGISGARNYAISHSTGNILAFVDCDDLWTDRKLELQIMRLISDSTIQAVFGYIRQFYSPEVDENYRAKYYFEDKPTKGIIPGTLVISKDDFLKTGLFNENLRLGELFDWIHRFKKIGFKYAVIPDIIMYRRLHYNNNGILNKKDRIDFVKAFAQIIKDKKNGKN